MAGFSVGYVDGAALSERTAFFKLTRWVIVFAFAARSSSTLGPAVDSRLNGI
jgi:hypothetical protein